MARNQKNKDVSPESVPTPVETSVVSKEPSAEPTLYVVVRDGFRVSDTTYMVADDPYAVAEHAFWKRVSDKSKDGTKVEVVVFDKKKHRVW